MRLFDSHAHLNDEELAAQADVIWRRAREAGVERIAVVGYDVPSSGRAVAIARQLEGLVATVGLHPYEAATSEEGDLREIARLAEDPIVRAIGEIGYDFHGEEPAPPERQDRLLRRQLEIARDLGLPAILHLRDSGTRIIRMLDAFPGVRAVFHCFSGGEELLDEGLARGAYISFAGQLTYKKNGELRELAARVPHDKLLVETDSPYLAPVPFRGKSNEPAYMLHTLSTLAAARGESTDDVAETTFANACTVFGIS